jgi:RNA polymerase sigma-70 factor (ECF subfamily)
MKQEKELVVQLYENHYHSLYNFFLKRLGSHEDAADGAQEVFMRLIRHHGTAELDSPDGYIWRTTQNLVKEIKRTRAIRLRWMAQQTEDSDEQVSQAPGPEEAMEIQQIREHALRVLNELPTRCREVFIMHRFKGLSHKEIARQLNISPRTVENHMVNALLFLRKRLPRP